MRASLICRLEIFRTVLDTGTTKAAADRLGVPEPEVSQKLAEAEQELGLILFVHEDGKLMPTQDGLAHYDELEFEFDGNERVKSSTTGSPSRHGSVLRIALPQSFCYAILPKALAAFSLQHPQLRYEIIFGNYPNIISLLTSRSVDLGIAKDPITNPTLITEPIGRCGTVCVLSRQHPLADRGQLTIDDIADEPLIMIGRTRQWRSEIDILYRRTNRVPKVRVETRSVGSACSLAAEKLGIAIVPEILARQYVSSALTVVPLDIPISHSFVVAYPATMPSRSLAVALAKTIASVVS